MSTKGPSFGYHPCAGNSYLIVKPEKAEAAKEHFRGTKVIIKTERGKTPRSSYRVSRMRGKICKRNGE